MSSYKRKWEETEDSDEEPIYGKQILPVADLPEDFNEEPMDGMQYLFMVRRDARHLPSTVRVHNPYEQPETTIIRNVIEDSLTNMPQLPSEEWRQLFEKRFRNFRKNIAQPTTHIGPTVPPHHYIIPDKKERDMWWAFLSGGHESEWIASKKGQEGRKQSAGIGALSEEHIAAQSSWNDEGKDDEELMINFAEVLPCPMDTSVPLDYLEALSQPSASASVATSGQLHAENPVPREPNTQFLTLINERAALHLLMYFTHWINLHVSSLDYDMYLPTETHARWIFSLLSRIDDFISPDDINLLRNLARACIGLLKQIKKQETSINCSMMSEPSCWIIIATVAEVWKQKDLWMDADSALRIGKA